MAWIWVSEETKREIEVENALLSRPIDIDIETEGMDDEYAGIVHRLSFEECGDDEDALVANGWNDDGSDAWEE